MTNLEQKLISQKAAYEQELNIATNEFERKLNATNTALTKTNIELNKTKTELYNTKQELKTTDLMLDQQLRNSKYVRQALDKEKANIHQLEREYTGLRNDLQNVTHSYRSIVGKIASIDVNISAIMARQSSDHSSIEHVQQKAGYMSAFTVGGTPKDGPTSGTVIFSYVQTNIGGNYNATSGQYTCPYSGIYIFFLSLYKSSKVNNAYCRIKRNTSVIGYAYAYGGSHNAGGTDEGSTTLIVRLAAGDVVYIGDCTGANTINEYSRFSGSLLKAD